MVGASEYRRGWCAVEIVGGGRGREGDTETRIWEMERYPCEANMSRKSIAGGAGVVGC